MNPQTLQAIATEALVPMELQPLILQAGQLHGAWRGDPSWQSLSLQWLERGDQNKSSTLQDGASCSGDQTFMGSWLWSAAWP